MFGLGSYFQSYLYDAAVRFPTPFGMHHLRQLAPEFFEYRRLRQMVILSEEFQYIYVINPKVVSTSIRNRLHELNGYVPLSDPRDVMGHRHSGFQMLKHMPAGRFRQALQSRNYFTFSFVRNPFTRLVSGYVYFQNELRKTLAYGERPKRLLVQRQADPKRDPKPRTFMSFDQYIRNACLNQTICHDQHFRPQTELLKLDHIRYDFIGRMEQFAADMKTVLTNLKAPEEVLARASQQTNSSSKKPQNMHQWYNDELADLVRHRYLRDFQTFGYDLEMPPAKTSPSLPTLHQSPLANYSGDLQHVATDHRAPIHQPPYPETLPLLA